MTFNQIDAPLLKRFFKKQFGISVRVQSSATKSVTRRGNGTDYVECHIPGRRVGRDLVYDQQFSAEFGNRCLRIIYGEGKGGEGTTISFPAGNVRGHMIVMHRRQWAALLTEHGYSETPLFRAADQGAV